MATSYVERKHKKFHVYYELLVEHKLAESPSEVFLMMYVYRYPG
jgi:hypothetical protein